MRGWGRRACLSPDGPGLVVLAEAAEAERAIANLKGYPANVVTVPGGPERRKEKEEDVKRYWTPAELTEHWESRRRSRPR